MEARRSGSRTVRLEVRFADRGTALPALRRLTLIPGVILNILRGRVTPREAVYELELTGRGPRVDQAVWSLWAAAGLG